MWEWDGDGDGGEVGCHGRCHGAPKMTSSQKISKIRTATYLPRGRVSQRATSELPRGMVSHLCASATDLPRGSFIHHLISIDYHTIDYQFINNHNRHQTNIYPLIVGIERHTDRISHENEAHSHLNLCDCRHTCRRRLRVLHALRRSTTSMPSHDDDGTAPYVPRGHGLNHHGRIRTYGQNIVQPC